MMRRSAVPMGLILLSLTMARGALAADKTPAPASHLMSLSLVVAGNEPSGGGGVHSLAPPVAKAIADIKDFLPYKQYEVQDTVVLRVASQAAPSRFELQGPDGRYVARMQYMMTDERRLNVNQFEMAKVGAAMPAPTPGQPGQEPETPFPTPTRQVLSTAFSVNVGETIVVGTSRLNHTGKALVVVLTVLPTP